jgi:hypothetical protein
MILSIPNRRIAANQIHESLPYRLWAPLVAEGIFLTFFGCTKSRKARQLRNKPPKKSKEGLK